MARVKLSEYQAKILIYDALGQDYKGLSVHLSDRNYDKIVKTLDNKGRYVCKIDQAIKKRNKLGLVKIDRTIDQLQDDLASFAQLGYAYALVEPFVEHSQEDEHYISLSRTEHGVELAYSTKGGNDVEEYKDSLQHALLQENEFMAADNKTDLNSNTAEIIYDLFQKSHMTLMEINPCVINKEAFIPLDAAVEVDSAAEFFVEDAWSDADLRQPKIRIDVAEQRIDKLNAQSPASLNLKVLNPNGQYFLLLSGGGASVVVADELAFLSKHSEIANYGEYSGNPSEEETKIYAETLLQAMLSSKAKHKVLVIAGGVANFTDVAATFSGIISVLKEMAPELKKQGIEVVVRRGGPNQAKGLKAMADCLNSIGLKNRVYGPDTSLSAAVAEAVKGLS